VISIDCGESRDPTVFINNRIIYIVIYINLINLLTYNGETTEDD